MNFTLAVARTFNREETDFIQCQAWGKTANEIQDGMRDFLKDGKQKANVKALKNAVYTLIGMSTQKTAGQRTDHPKHITFEVLELLKWQIICESVALVLSGKLDELEDEQ